MSEKGTRFYTWYCNLIFHLGPQVNPVTASRPKAGAWKQYLWHHSGLNAAKWKQRWNSNKAVITGIQARPPITQRLHCTAAYQPQHSPASGNNRSLFCVLSGHSGKSLKLSGNSVPLLWMKAGTPRYPKSTRKLIIQEQSCTSWSS